MRSNESKKPDGQSSLIIQAKLTTGILKATKTKSKCFSYTQKIMKLHKYPSWQTCNHFEPSIDDVKDLHHWSTYF